MVSRNENEGEGPGGGLLRDCTTSPINRLQLWSADIRVLADSGEDHGLITGAVWIGTRGLIKVHLHLSTCVLYSNWSIQVLSSTRRQQQTVHVVNPKTGISSQDLWTDWKCS